jgi:hypothetical protein
MSDVVSTSKILQEDNISNSNKYSDSKQEIELLNVLDKKGLGTDWYSGNIITLVEWLNISSLYILILDKEISYYKKTLNRITFLGLLFSTITSTISLSQLSISETEHPNLALSLKIMFSFTSIFTTVAAGALKINNVQSNLDTCLEYYKQWNCFAAEISGQFQLPIPIRKNALSIIIRLKSTFKELFTTRLPLTNNIKESASNIIENKTYVETNIKDKRGNLLLKRNICCYNNCFKSRRNTKIHNYFCNRLSVYYMYQDIIITELDALVRELNKSNPSKKISYRIEPTKIVVDTDTIDDICVNTARNKNKTQNKTLLCSVNPNFNMNQSQNDSVYELASSKFTCGFYKSKKNHKYGAEYYFNLIVLKGREFTSLVDNIRDFIINCDIKTFKEIILESDCTITSLNLINEVIIKSRQFVEKDILIISKYNQNELNNKSYPNKEDMQNFVIELQSITDIIQNKNIELLEKESTILTNCLGDAGENNLELENALNNQDDTIHINVT